MRYSIYKKNVRIESIGFYRFLYRRIYPGSHQNMRSKVLIINYSYLTSKTLHFCLYPFINSNFLKQLSFRHKDFMDSELYRSGISCLYKILLWIIVFLIGRLRSNKVEFSGNLGLIKADIKCFENQI